MRRLSLAALCLAAINTIHASADIAARDASSGCGAPLPSGQTAGNVYNVSITSGGLARYYLISIPPTYNTSATTPLILSYHGGTKTAQNQLQLDLFTSTYFNNNTFVVYPQGINVSRCMLLSQSRMLTLDRTPGKEFPESRPTTLLSRPTS